MSSIYTVCKPKNAPWVLYKKKISKYILTLYIYILGCILTYGRVIAYNNKKLLAIAI